MSQRLGQVYQLATESRIRTIDWSAALGTDTINTSSWVILPAGLTTVGQGSTTTTTTIQLTAGAVGLTYQIENTIVTVGVQTLKRHFLVTVTG